ncbi:hypothetical protein C8F04DRAFT_1192715 [Mycena alexandri]|uniref:Uncharacterized protein n=1 Tax=Mycena alexandri TaxID=1745969 RepID=A0AAD6SES8_9AGAR|nr:hypothetical protein C8F04DRAFT_1192715 [Mycena alexandri]
MSDPPNMRNRNNPATPEHLNTPTFTLSNLESHDNLSVEGSAEEACSVAVGNVTVRRGSRRRVPALSPDVEILHSANVKQSQQPTPRSTPSPHRPGPQLIIRDDDSLLLAPDTLAPDHTPEATTDPGAARDDRGKRGGAPSNSREPPPLRGRQVKESIESDSDDYADALPGKPKSKGGRDKAKQRAYAKLRKTAAAVLSIDDLADILAEQVKTMRAYPTAPTKDCLAVLDALATRLKDHRTLPVVDEDRATFSSVVARSVLDPMKSLAAQIEGPAQGDTESGEDGGDTSYAQRVVSASLPMKARSAPLPHENDERILVRFAGPPPPFFHLPYQELVEKLNERLVPMGLPEILFAQKQVKGVQGLFIAPASGKEGAEALTRRWSEWGPSVLPGGGWCQSSCIASSKSTEYRSPRPGARNTEMGESAAECGEDSGDDGGREEAALGGVHHIPTGVERQGGRYGGGGAGDAGGAGTAGAESVPAPGGGPMLGMLSLRPHPFTVPGGRGEMWGVQRQIPWSCMRGGAVMFELQRGA